VNGSKTFIRNGINADLVITGYRMSVQLRSEHITSPCARLRLVSGHGTLNLDPPPRFLMGLDGA